MANDKYIDTIEKDGQSYGIRAEEAQIKGLIQADKDIISQIEVSYDEDNNTTTFTFPKNIVPIMYYNETYASNLYPNFDNGKVINELGEEEGTIITDFDNSTIIFVISSTLDIETEYDGLYFIYFNNIDTICKNWYAILNPQPAGTKLYRHNFQMAWEDDENNAHLGNFTMVTTSSTSVTGNQTIDSLYSFIEGNIFISFIDGQEYRVVSIYHDSGEINIDYINVGGTYKRLYIFYDIIINSDTVTEL